MYRSSKDRGKLKDLDGMYIARSLYILQEGLVLCHLVSLNPELEIGSAQNRSAVYFSIEHSTMMGGEMTMEITPDQSGSS